MKKDRFFSSFTAYHNFVTTGLLFFFSVLGFLLIGCSKDDEKRTSAVDTTRPSQPVPTGLIKEFYIDDSLIGYDRGTFVRWYVSETNLQTVVTLNGVKVAFNDAVTTGPLKTDVSYILAVNNGLMQTRMIKVADKLTTNLWNSGKRWRLANVWINQQVKKQGSQGQDTLVYDWVSVFDVDKMRYQDIRTSFALTGDSKEEYLNYNYYYGQLKPSGKFVAMPDALPNPVFIWKNRVYTVDSISPLNLVVSFDTTNYSGAVVKNRVKYIPE